MKYIKLIHSSFTNVLIKLVCGKICVDFNKLVKICEALIDNHVFVPLSLNFFFFFFCTMQYVDNYKFRLDVCQTREIVQNCMHW